MCTAMTATEGWIAITKKTSPCLTIAKQISSTDNNTLDDYKYAQPIEKVCQCCLSHHNNLFKQYVKGFY